MKRTLTQSKAYQADALLLLTALIWGSGFVAQRLGMEAIGPMLYNALRFALGALIILPLALWPASEQNTRLNVMGGIAAGALVFMGASFQQVGLLYIAFLLFTGYKFRRA